MTNENLNESHSVPRWLKDLQENSWELELLISGGAIFSLFQINGAFVEWTSSLSVISRIPGTVIMTFLGVAVIWTLTFGFAAHLLSRAYWLALVCINYVFPNGINTQGVKFARPFSPAASPGDDLQKQIIQVDRLCGLIIYSTIAGAVIIFGLLCGFAPLLIWEALIGNTISVSQVTDALSWFLTYSYLFYFVDFILAGLFRKIPYLSYLTYPVFIFYDFFTLRRFYGRSLKLLTSNTRYVQRLFGVALVLACVVIATYLTLFRKMHWPNVFDSREMKWQMADGIYLSNKSYRDMTEENEMYGAVSIQSKFIQKGYLELFLRYEKKTDFIRQQVHGADTSIFFSDLWAISIDGVNVDSIQWYPTWNSSIYNIGITGVLRIDTLSLGEHYLQVSCKDYVVSDGHDLCEKYTVTIPFWRDMYN